MGESTIVCGDEISETCILKAGLLTFRMYRTAKESLDPRLHPYWDIAHDEWDEVWREEFPDGFQCGYFVPKGASCGPDGCPPVLVFRGSDAEGGPHGDFDNLGLAVRCSLDPFIDAPWPKENIDPDAIVIDKVFSPDPDINVLSFSQIKAQAAALSLTEEVLFPEQTGTETFPLVVDWYGDAEVEIAWSMQVSLFYGTRGDWTVDFAQGLGAETSQYLSARDYGRAAAAEAMASHGRMIITGHSLGGGLATCAGIAIRSMSEYDDLKLHVRGYNPAGLHDNTAIMAGGTKSMAGAVPTRLEHVKDEMLNSLQAKIVPFLNPLLEMGGKSMPRPSPTPQSVPGVSPGAMFVGEMEMKYADYGGALPTLFPLSQADALAGVPLDRVIRLNAMLDNANTPRDFIQSLLDFLIRGISGAENLSASQATELQTAIEGGAIPDDILTDIADAVTQGTTAPTIDLGGSAYFNNTAEPFLNGLLAEFVGLGRILLASGLYHTFPPCASTLIVPGLPTQE